MTFQEFRRLSEQIFAEIPDDYKAGVEGIEVSRRAVLHPGIAGVYTLGECLSEFYPSDFGGPGEVRSRVVLYHGSFLEVARGSEEWVWEDEIWETITHEVRHHLEHLASEDALEEIDYAEDQNFARREGERFDPFFYRSGQAVQPGEFQVDGDRFLELAINQRTFERNREIEVVFADRTIEVPMPADLGDVHYLRICEDPPGSSGERFLVLVRKRRWGEWLREAFGSRALEVLYTDLNSPRADKWPSS